MADNLLWITVNAFVGVDYSTTDHLLQPTRRQQPVTMRRMLSVDPFKERGQFEPAPGYFKYADAVVGASRTGIHGHVSNGSMVPFQVVNGNLYYLAGDVWTQVVSSHLPLNPALRTRFSTGYNALFMCDGSDKPKVYGWNYDPSDATLTWDTEHLIAEINNTRGAPGEDFKAEGCCFHMTRLVLWKDREVRLSAPYLPTTFYDPQNDAVGNSWFVVGENDGTDITMCTTFENQMLVVGKPYSLHGYIGDDPASSYSHIVLDASRGIYAPDSVAMGGGRMYFCAYEGPCFLDINKGVEYIGDPIRPLWDSMTYQQKQAVQGWYEDNLYHIVLPINYLAPLPQEYPTECSALLSYDPVTKRWAEAFGVSGNTAVCLPSGSEQFAITQYSDGTIYRQRTGTSLDGDLITQEMESPWLTFGEPWRNKWIRMITLELEQSAPTVELAIGLDYAEQYNTWTIEAKRPTHWWGEPGIFWLPRTDPGHIVWNGGGRYTIEMPHTMHGKTMRLRIRGQDLKMRSIGIGFLYEGT